MEKLGHKVLTFSSVTTDKMQKEISILNIKKTIQFSDIRIKLQKCLINGHLPDCLRPWSVNIQKNLRNVTFEWALNNISKIYESTMHGVMNDYLNNALPKFCNNFRKFCCYKEFMTTIWLFLLLSWLYQKLLIAFDCSDNMPLKILNVYYIDRKHKRPMQAQHSGNFWK